MITEGKIDDETELWPIPAEFRENLSNIKKEYRAIPLPAYRGTDFIEVSDVNDALAGALVEIKFDLRHFSFTSKKQDSFNGSLGQVRILQAGVKTATSVLKRKNIREGPVLDRPAIRLLKNASDTSRNPQSSESSQSKIVVASDDEQVERSLLETTDAPLLHTTTEKGTIYLNVD